MVSAVLTPLFFKWRNKKGKASIYAADTSFEDVGMSTIMSVGSGAARPDINGRLILRPPFGTRILGPLVAAAILAFFDFGPALASVGLADPNYQRWLGYAMWALLAYTVVVLNLRQRVVVDGETLSCTGVQLSPQTRDLTGLVNITVHPKRPALVLTFAGQPRLYIPKHLTGRSTFVPLMEEIAARNRAAGLSAKPEGLMARAGF